jgi:CheY-like chemotaxis protein
MCIVLVADDDPIVRDLVCAVLGSAGHQCLPAANGLEAVAVFRSNRDRIDVVLTDIMMPVMDGTQAAARIRETNPGIPIIFMTGYSSEVALPPGVHFLEKPFTPQALIGAVNRVAPG